MKNFKYLIILLLLSLSCSNYQDRFSYIDNRKELELDFHLNKDSTFTLIDSFGCNVNYQRGKWKKISNPYKFLYSTYVLTDTIKTFEGVDIHGKKYEYYISSFNKLKVVNSRARTFPIITNDTIYFYTKNNFVFNKYNFTKEKGNIQNKRILKLEDSLINIYGKKLYVDFFGEGKSLETARRNLKRCN